MKKYCLALIVYCSLVTAQDFPRGVFLGNYFPLASDTAAIYNDLKNTLHLNMLSATVSSPSHQLFSKSFDIIAREINLWDYSTGQRMVYQAEDAVPSSSNPWEKNYFASKVGETDPISSSFWRIRKNIHSAGYLVKDAVPDSEYHFLQYGRKWYTARFIMKADTIGIGKTTLVADLRIFSKSNGGIKDSMQLRAYNFSGSSAIDTFKIRFCIDSVTCPSTPIKPPKWDKLTGGAQTMSVASLCQEKIDIQVYWNNNADMWLDKVIVEDDSIGKKLFAGNLTSAAISTANTFSSATKLNRFYLYDEPPVSSLLGYNYIDNILQTQTTGADPGFTPTFYTESKLTRFIADAQPKEIVVDNYVIISWIPHPTVPAAETTALGLASYAANEGFSSGYEKYRHRLQVHLDVLDSVFNSAATRAGANSKKFWYTAQTHGILSTGTKKYNSLRPVTSAELKATIGMALAYGAKGILGWPYQYINDGSDYIYTGLVDTLYRHSTNYFKVTGSSGDSIYGGFRDMFDGYAQSMSRIKDLASTLTQLSWQGTKRWHSTYGGFVQTFGSWGGLISSVITKTTAGTTDPDWQYIVETGHLTYGGNDYILAVNRRCDPTDTRNITFTMGTTGYKQITNLSTGKKYIIGTSGSFTDTFTPGEFTLYKVETMPFTWSGDISVMNAVTVNSGTTLTVNSGTLLRFATGQGLTMNGKLTANGTQASPIRFVGLIGDTAGSWGSIILNGSGAHASKISNAIVKYATELRVINVSPPYYYFTVDSVTFDTTVNAVNSYGSNGWVMNSKINFPKDHGILANDGSTISCYHNQIKKTNHSGAGILYGGGSSDLLWHNDITGFDWGVGVIWGSSPTFGHPSNTGINNRVTNCSNGLRIYEDSYPGIGYYDDYTTYGNSIYNNSPYNAYLSNCTEDDIYAFDVYWADTLLAYIDETKSCIMM